MLTPILVARKLYTKTSVLVTGAIIASLAGCGDPQERKIVLSQEQRLQKEIEEIKSSISDSKFLLATSALEMEKMAKDLEYELTKAMIEAKYVDIDPKEFTKPIIERFRLEIQVKKELLQLYREILQEETLKLRFKQAELARIRQAKKSPSNEIQRTR